jgi:hypothetical protein
MTLTASHPAWLNRKEAARYLKSLGWAVTPRTMENWAANNNLGKGPAFTRFGWKTVRYLKEDLDSWSEARKARVG